MPTTYERLRDILVKDYGVKSDAIAPETQLENLGVDSLGLADLLFTIEDEFKVTVSRDPVKLVSVAEVGDYIDRLIVEQSLAAAAVPVPVPVPPAAGVEPAR